jgi:hypothetical protein
MRTIADVAASLDGSALTGNETMVASAAGLTLACEGPNNSSSANAPCNSRMAPMTSGEFASPSITTSTGELRPPENSVVRSSKACRDGASTGNVLTPAFPVLMLRNDRLAATSIPPATTRLIPGRLITRRAIAFQNRCELSEPNSVRRRNTLSEFTRSPRRLSSAGSSVSEARTATTTTKIAPAAMLRKMVVGTMSIPIRARTTVRPLKNTARLAVALELVLEPDRRQRGDVRATVASNRGDPEEFSGLEHVKGIRPTCRRRSICRWQSPQPVSLELVHQRKFLLAGPMSFAALNRLTE